MFIGVSAGPAQLSADFHKRCHFSSCGSCDPDVNTASPKRRGSGNAEAAGRKAVAQTTARIQEVRQQTRREFRRVGCFASLLFEVVEILKGYVGGLGVIGV